MKRDDSSPAAYVADVEGEQREMIEIIRAVIREIAPEIREGIQYGMLDYPGLCNVAAQKQYVSVYTDWNVLANHRHLIPGVSCGKSCIRFRRKQQILDSRLPELLKEVLEYRR